MSLTDDNLVSNGWASLMDCKRYLWDIHELLGFSDEADTESLLTASIQTATAAAKAILRRRYVDDLPFDTPPADIRQRIAVCATYFAVRSRAYSVGSHEGLLQALAADCEQSREWFNAIAAGEIPLEFEGVDIATPTITPPPDGEFGFDKH